MVLKYSQNFYENTRGRNFFIPPRTLILDTFLIKSTLLFKNCEIFQLGYLRTPLNGYFVKRNYIQKTPLIFQLHVALLLPDA